MGQFLKLYQ